MHLIIDFKIPGDPRLHKTSDSRALVAKVLDGRSQDLDLVRALMHVDDAGKNRGSLSPVRFGARAQNVITLNVVGSSACEYFLRNSHRLTMALSEYFGCSIEESRHFGPTTIEDTGRWFSYHIPAFVWQRGPVISEDLVEAVKANAITDAALLEVVEDQLRIGIERQCDLIGVDIPELLMFELKLFRLFPVPVGKGTKRYFAAATIDFRSNVHLLGPWHVGRLCGRGYGLILPGGKKVVALTTEAGNLKEAA